LGIRTRLTDALRATSAKVVLVLIVSVVLSGLSAGPATADPLVVAANDGVRTPTLQQRRSASRNAEVRKLQRYCRVTAQKVKSFRIKKCIAGDRLDKRTNICHPRKARYQSYLRWDPAAGRCKPRHSYLGSSCAGGKRRYNPGKHHAQSVAQSANMFARASVRAEAELNQCRRALQKLQRFGAAERRVRQRDCAQARTLKRPDLIKFYCQ
jgi:hypothetical protein